jgi:hypothetical protein
MRKGEEEKGDEEWWPIRVSWRFEWNDANLMEYVELSLAESIYLMDFVVRK